MSTGNTNNPRVLVLGPTRAGWSANGKSLEETRQNAIESWTYVFDGDYRYIREISPELIKNYDIVIVNSKLYGEDNTKLLTKLSAISESRPANLKWVTSIEGPAEDYTKPDAFMKMLLDSSDLVNCINKHSLSLLRSLTSAKVEFIGFPYPVENISKLSVPINQRLREVFICPSLLARWNDYFVAKELGLPVTGWEFRSNRKMRLLIPELKKYKSVLRNAKSKLMKSVINLVNPNKYVELVNNYYEDVGLAIKSNMHLNNFYETYNKYFLWLNLDDRYTWGRYVLDAAALQIPIITTKSTGHGDELFPLACLEHEYEIDKAIELCNKLIKNDEFYRQVASYPVGKLEHLKAENMKRKLLEGLGV